MRHAGADALERLAPLLEAIRASGRFKEPRPGVFTMKGRSALHFHEDPTGLHADVRLEGADYVRRRIETDEERRALLVGLGIRAEGPPDQAGSSASRFS